MTLSICTMFYDANKNLFSKWIEKTKEAVKIPYELVVTDNTSAQDLPQTDGVKIVRAGGNVLPFEGRRLAVEAASGDYCFLVDCDDLILPILDFPFEEDEICCNYFGTRDADFEKMYPCENAYPLAYTASNTDFFNDFWRRAAGNMTWNKFFKRELLLRIYAKLPRGLRIAFMEDTLLCLLALAETKSIRFTTKAYYCYAFGAGMTTKEQYTDIAPLQRYAAGMAQAMGLFHSAFPEKRQEQANITTAGLYRGAAEYFTSKLLLVAPELRKNYIKTVIAEYFAPDIAEAAAKRLCENKKITKEEKNFIIKQLNNYNRGEQENAR